MNKLNKKGLTLIEVILAMAIFSIIAVAFLAMFSTSLIWIFRAGDKAEAYSMVQKDIERRIITEDTVVSEDLIIVFGDNENEEDNNLVIRGGVVESSMDVNLGSSSLETFLSYVPTITLNRSYISEGEVDARIKIIGKYTHFSKVNSKVEILNIDGTTIPQIDPISPELVTFIDENRQELEFDLPIVNDTIDLLNNHYIIRVKTTNVEDVGTEYARAKLIVEQPMYIAAGDTNVYISADGKNWVDRAEMPNFTSDININSLTSNGTNYVMAGDLGEIHFSLNNDGWHKSSTNNNIEINDVFWSSAHRRYYLADEAGALYYSDNGQNWSYLTIANEVNNKSLNSINISALTETHTVFSIVGEGIIAYKINDGFWNTSNIGDIILKSVVSSNDRLVAVGYKLDAIEGEDKGVVMTYTYNKGGWSEPFYLDDYILYDVVSSYSSNSFIAVGDKGKIWKLSFDGEGNLSTSVDDLGNLDDNLVSIHRQGTIVIIVSNDGDIFYSENDGMTYTKVAELGVELRAISGR